MTLHLFVFCCSESPVIIQGPTQSVSHGGNVTLQCRYRRFPPKNIAFYKDGMEIQTPGDGKMTMWGVTKEDEGFYWCSGEGTGMISAETWVSVTGEMRMAAVLLRETLQLHGGKRLKSNHKMGVGGFTSGGPWLDSLLGGSRLTWLGTPQEGELSNFWNQMKNDRKHSSACISLSANQYAWFWW